MNAVSPRVRLVLAMLLALSITPAAPSLPSASAEERDDALSIEHFMAGLACIESSGRYTARNPRSGAYGKYQIMPGNWRVWGKRFLGDRKAEPTPQNQEIVARAKIQRLHKKRGTWRRVAYWWLSGREMNDESLWSRKGVRYVDWVMRLANRAAKHGPSRSVPRRCFPKLPGPGSQNRSDSKQRVRVAARSVWVRRGPGIENRSFAIVRRGMVLTQLDQGRDPRGRRWLKVALKDGRRGWVAGWFTRPVAWGE